MKITPCLNRLDHQQAGNIDRQLDIGRPLNRSCVKVQRRLGIESLGHRRDFLVLQDAAGTAQPWFANPSLSAK